MTKKIYRVRNWEEYNKGLVQRGSLTFWFSQEIIEGWRIEKNKDSHGNQKYSDKVNLGIKENTKARHILVDSTGVQVIGEGEWKKLHIAIDADSHEILAAT